MAYQALGLGSSANDGTGDDLRTGGDKINDNFVELYTKLGNGSALSNLTFPTGTDTIVGRATTDTLTNKTLTSPTVSGLTLSDASIVIEGATADASETTITVTDPTADRTITIPDATGTVSLVTGTETLTNKTLTSPVLTTPRIADAGFIADANGAEQIIFQTTASAVNEIEITNAATGGAASAGTSTAPIIGASGETNVDLALLPKGTGHVAIRSTGGTNNQGAIRLNCENNTHGQTLMSQPHSSGDSGFFKLPLDGGSARATPNVLLSGAKTIVQTETANGAGSSVALSLNTAHSAIVTTGAQAFSLANGVNGQVKTISMVTDGGDATLTPATLAGGSTIVFNDVGDSVVLIYNTTGGWAVLSNNGTTIS